MSWRIVWGDGTASAIVTGRTRRSTRAADRAGFEINDTWPPPGYLGVTLDVELNRFSNRIQSRFGPCCVFGFIAFILAPSQSHLLSCDNRIHHAIAYSKRKTPFTQRMAEDMQVRNLSPRTIGSYTYHVDRLAKHFGKDPVDLGPEEVRDFPLWIIKEKKSWSQFNQADPLAWQVQSTLTRIGFCRTQSLGSHVYHCGQLMR